VNAVRDRPRSLARRYAALQYACNNSVDKDAPMTFARPALPIFALTSALALASCGGGDNGPSTVHAVGSTSGTSGNTGTGGETTSWVQGQYAAPSTFAAMCATPRTGTDPATGQTYPDRAGTALDEKNWLRSWTNQLYLWFDEVQDRDPSGYTTDDAYFQVLKTTATTASGAPKDKFHFTYATSTWESLSQSDQEAGYGANFNIIVAAPPRTVVVSYTEPNTPATAANLTRGTKILAIDGADSVNATDSASIATLNAGLSPATAGETHTFSVMDPGATTPRTVTLVSADITSSPVQNVHTLAAPNGELVGYLLFNDNLATAESAMIAAVNQLKTAGVKDLVLDIRYNGGGLLNIASEVAYMIAGPGPTAGQTFELSQFNSKYPTTNPITGGAITPLGFLATTTVQSTGTALPSLNLARVFVLTGSSTCSASESIINGLQGVGVEVIQIGSTTCGKPYAFYPQDNCGVTYFSIELQGVNAKGFGAYPDGFTPRNTKATQGVLVDGCSVADDFTHALGDANEGVLSSALGYLATGSCPVAPSAVAPATLAGAYVPPQANGVSIKSFRRENRLFRSL
jgi:carboxyl-terminal processing protease